MKKTGVKETRSDSLDWIHPAEDIHHWVNLVEKKNFHVHETGNVLTT
jgi:hypothetical protein